MSTTNGGARPNMTQTSHGKNFPYSMHSKTNSNKLPHIGSNDGKGGVGGPTGPYNNQNDP